MSMNAARWKDQFVTPADEFTQIPFWFWNDDLAEETIIAQIRDFKEKGVLGFVIHPRIGIPREIVYLSDRYMELVQAAVEEAQRQQMIVYLYDEAMYPSGSAQGRVVQGNPEYASRGLKILVVPCTKQSMEFTPALEAGENLVSIQAAVKTADQAIEWSTVQILRTVDGNIQFTAPDQRPWHMFIFVETFSRGVIRGIHYGDDDADEGAPLSADLLNPAAVAKFIRLTHDRYYEKLAPYFGKTIQAMFTDEPSMLGKRPLPGLIPWTNGFLEWYTREGNDERDLLALWYGTGEVVEQKRRRYRQAINNKLTESYYRPIARWCKQHQITFTGHPHGSADIGLLEHFDLPGQDIVWRWVAPEGGLALEGEHSTLAKCSSDAARHAGKRRNANECFGVCTVPANTWNLTAGDMKWYMDWLFIRGVNLLIPHAFYYSIQCERINERPPDVGPNNIWWPYYRQIADYIKRMSWLMTDSVNITSIAVLCTEDELPWHIVKPLYEHQIEFNYLEQRLICSDACSISDEGLAIVNQQYQVVIVENMHWLTETLCMRLQEFIFHGGTVIVYNPSGQPIRLQGISEIHQFVDIVGEVRQFLSDQIRLTPPNPDLRVSHVRKGDVDFYLLVNEGDQDIAGKLKLNGATGLVELWNPWTGAIELISSDMDINKENRSKGDNRGVGLQGSKDVSKEGCQGTEFSFRLDYRESIIVCVDPSSSATPVPAANKEHHIISTIKLDEGWRLIQPSDLPPKSVNLSSWTQWPGMEHYSGTLVYECDFTIAEHLLRESITIQVDLGEAHELAHVYINDQEAGYKMWRPYRFDLSGRVRAGSNVIRVAVSNSRANAINHLLLPSGLLGPVTLRLISH